MSNSKEIIKVGLILFAITAVSALLLAYANKITAPLIEINTQKKTEEAMQKVFPDGESFDKIDFEGENVKEVYIAKTSGESIGACVVSTGNGYGGDVSVVTGVKADGSVTGIDILEHSETPGLGANATKDEFKNQYAGKTKGIEAKKGSASGNDIVAMSGATITSKAVTSAVNTAVEAAEQALKEVK